MRFGESEIKRRRRRKKKITKQTKGVTSHPISMSLYMHISVILSLGAIECPKKNMPSRVDPTWTQLRHGSTGAGSQWSTINSTPFDSILPNGSR